MSPPFTRRQYAGGAVATSVNGGLTNTTAVFDVADGSTYPTATFFCVIDEGLATEEKIFVASRSGNTFSSVLRGEDGTTALPHASGAVIRHVFVAQDADEADFIATVMTVKGDLLARGATAPVRVPVGAYGWVLSSNPSTASGLDWVDNNTFLQVVNFDARGDLLIGTGDNAMARAAVGASGQVLTADPLAFPTTFVGYAYPTAVLTTTQRNALTGAALWRGRPIFNTTTGAVEYWYGATTGWRQPWSMPWGAFPYATTTSVQTFTGTYAPIVGLSSNFTSVAGRRYQASAKISFTTATGTGPWLLALVADGNIIAGSEVETTISVTGSTATLVTDCTFEPIAESLTVIPSIAVLGGGTGTLTQRSGTISATLQVADVGPVGNAPAS